MFWKCKHCGSLNRGSDTKCKMCRHPHEINAAQKAEALGRREFLRERIGLVVSRLFSVVVILLLSMLVTKEVLRQSETTVEAKQWQKVVWLFEEEQVEKSGYQLPEGIEPFKTEEVEGKEEWLIDHYEDVTQEIPYEAIVSYSEDDGKRIADFEPKTISVTESIPVYKRCKTGGMIYYWHDSVLVPSGSVIASGTDDTPHWPEVPEDIASTYRNEQYVLTIRKGDDTVEIEVDEATFKKYKVGDKIAITRKGSDYVVREN